MTSVQEKITTAHLYYELEKFGRPKRGKRPQRVYKKSESVDNTHPSMQLINSVKKPKRNAYDCSKAKYKGQNENRKQQVFHFELTFFTPSNLINQTPPWKLIKFHSQLLKNTVDTNKSS